MFDLETQIKNWRRELFCSGIKRPEVLDELENHLREEFQRGTTVRTTPEEVFRSAVAQLGDSALLKREFAKVSRSAWAIWRDNPATLNLLGFWFIITGLNAASILGPFMWSGPRGATSTILDMLLFVMTWQMVIGAGLLYRRSFARFGAVGWAAPSCAVYLVMQIYVHTHGPYTGPSPSSLGIVATSHSASAVRYYFLGLPLPMIFLQVFSFLNLGLLLWGCRLLTQPRIRALFHKESSHV